MPKRKKTLREKAEANVLAVRGSYDAPGFDLCVEQELQRLKTIQTDRIAARRFGEPSK